MKFNALIPELLVSDINNSLSFYKDLGFSVIYQRSNPDFIFLKLENAQIMLQQMRDKNIWEIKKPKYPFGCGINFQILLPSIKKIASIVEAPNINVLQNVKTNTYWTAKGIVRQKELFISDPDGYVLRFSEILADYI